MLNLYKKIKAFSKFSSVHFELKSNESLYYSNWFLYIINFEVNQMFGTNFYSKIWTCIWNVEFVLFSIRFLAKFGPKMTPKTLILLNLDEAVLNLLMELPTWNIIKLGNLGVKLSKIKTRIWILCQFNSCYSCKVKYEKVFGE